MITQLIEFIYRLLWGDLFFIHIGNTSFGISLMILLLIPAGIYFTVRTRVLPIRLFPDMICSLNGKKDNQGGLSSFQSLIVSTATRVGMGNLVGVVAAISAGGAGAVFWMWLTALVGASTAFVEATSGPDTYKTQDPSVRRIPWRSCLLYPCILVKSRPAERKNVIPISVACLPSPA